MKTKQITDAGTAAQYDAGTSANNIIQLDGDAKIPAVDGSNITGVSGGGGSVDPAPYNFVEVSSTSDYTISDSSNNGTVYYFSASSGSTDVYLPEANVVGEGFFVLISSKFRVYIKPKSGSSDTIPYFSSTLEDNFRIDANDALTVVSGGSRNAWYIINHGST